MIKKTILLGLLWTMVFPLSAQTLHLEEALQIALNNYEKIKSKEYALAASKQDVEVSKRNYLPNLTIAAQQNYGTINAQNGPLYGQGGLGVASTSMPIADQNWNAAFGSLYLANVNWDFFTFGRYKNQTKVAELSQQVREQDLSQEKFQYQIKVMGAYLNLLATQRIRLVQQINLDRAEVFMTTTLSKVESGLLPGVDASLAKAEVSNAKSALLLANDKVFDHTKNLAVLMGVAYQDFELDSTFLTQIPVQKNSFADNDIQQHPYLQYQKGQIETSKQRERLFRSEGLPVFSLFGVMQGRGSGFGYNYVQDQSAYSKNYLDGVGIHRTNYILGLGLSWNITNWFRNQPKIKSQGYHTQSLNSDYELTHQELLVQSKMAEVKLVNALDNYKETPIQVKAASDAYKQSIALYDNGLSTIVDLTQAHYVLNRAETDNEIAFNNVWQALLLKTAASGDLDIFLSELLN